LFAGVPVASDRRLRQTGRLLPIVRQRAFRLQSPVGGTLVKATLVAALLFGAATVATAQPAPARAPKYFEDALVRFENNDTAGAIVQLKNALQQDPKLLAAYVLLGRAQLAEGDATAAEDAFDQYNDHEKIIALYGKKQEVPEPSSLFLLAAGGFELWRFRQTRRS
jgi:cytochrome c-type biogenesis protein CcmH/NrfG